jgi:enediyne polyketide synthase
LTPRLRTAGELYDDAVAPAGGGDPAATETAQPRIVAASLAGLRVLAGLGIQASGAAGHSPGELTALHWAGVLDETAVRDLARTRGRIMAEHGAPGGAMAPLATPPEVAGELLAGTDVVVAGYNAARQTVIAGPEVHLRRVLGRAAGRDVAAGRLEVSHAFHSPGLAPAAEVLGAHLRQLDFAAPARRVWSTVTGAELPADVDVAKLLERQVCRPVRFADAVARPGPPLRPADRGRASAPNARSPCAARPELPWA